MLFTNSGYKTDFPLMGWKETFLVSITLLSHIVFLPAKMLQDCKLSVSPIITQYFISKFYSIMIEYKKDTNCYEKLFKF